MQRLFSAALFLALFPALALADIPLAEIRTIAPVQWESQPPLKPFNHTAFYKVSWGGITVGSIVASTEETPDSYQMQASIRTTGLIKLFTRHHSLTTIQGIRDGERYLPQYYHSNFSTRGKARDITLKYAPAGTMVEQISIPPENTDKRPAVPMTLKARELDVLSLFFAQRQKIYEALARDNPEFSLRFYDGRRLTDLHFKVSGRKAVNWQGKNTPVIHFTMKRVPVAGYKEKEIKAIQKKEPAIDLYFSDDGLLVPLKIVLTNSQGSFYANLAQNCSSWEACLALQGKIIP